jgi:hypothetical protein
MDWLAIPPGELKKTGNARSSGCSKNARNRSAAPESIIPSAAIHYYNLIRRRQAHLRNENQRPLVELCDYGPIPSGRCSTPP